MDIGNRLRRLGAAQPAGGPRAAAGRASTARATPVACAEFAQVGVEAQLLQDDELSFLLVSSRVEPTQTMLLPTGPGTPPRGLSAFSRMGRWHAVHWALVWGWGPPPAGDVLFTSSDLRFRREARVPARALSHGWLAVCEGAFSTAAFAGPAGPDTWLDLAPQW